MKKNLCALLVCACFGLYGCTAWQGNGDSSSVSASATVPETASGVRSGVAHSDSQNPHADYGQALEQLRVPQIPAELCARQGAHDQGAHDRGGARPGSGTEANSAASSALSPAGQSAKNSDPPAQATQAIPYTVSFTIRSAVPGVIKPVPVADASTLESLLREHSLLLRLSDNPPSSISGLERRALADVASARQILQSQGYYAGWARYYLDTEKKPARITLVLTTGAQFRLGTSRIVLDGSADTSGVRDSLRTLADVGLDKGAPARAGAIQEAVERIPEYLQRHGYPFARVLRTRYVLDSTKQTLDADITVQTGGLALMGDVEVEGAESVNPDYIKRMRTWRLDRIWNESQIEAYQEELRQTGLFSSVQVEPFANLADKSTLPVLVSVLEAPHKTVGGGLKYSTDMGGGLNAYWENRNVFGEGELLRVELPIWEKRQEGRISFRKPHYGQKSQNLVAEAWARNEDSDAYKQKAVWSAAGIERRLSRNWWVSARASVEAGQLDERRKPASSYSMLGIPLGLRFDNTDSLLDPTHGLRLNVAASPYSGEYRQAFTVFRTRVDTSAYYPVLDNKLVLAGRLSTGGISGSPVETIPGSIRFYGGGGGSVRGYAYQSLGPRDDRDRPEGGASFLETSLELRFRITETIGIVPFLDGGNVFSTSSPSLGDELRWGTGIGLRYYTSIGSLRCDVATPIDPRQDDAPLQVYLSIGQSF